MMVIAGGDGYWSYLITIISIAIIISTVTQLMVEGTKLVAMDVRK